MTKRADTPLSVVIASVRSRGLLAETITSLEGQASRLGAELVVARVMLPGDAAWLRDSYPRCVVVECEAGSSIPVVRGRGLAAAKGDWVALTEDNCVVDALWLDALAAALRVGENVRVLGGVMSNARPERMLDWGAFFSEYGFFGPRRPKSLATGANVAYHRAVVTTVAELAKGGAWEDQIHAQLAERGEQFEIVQGAVVLQQLSYDLRDFCVDRYEHGRGYAATRGRSLGALRRFVLAAGSVILPALLALRIWKADGGRHASQFLRALPATLVFLGAWSMGEAAGYLAGDSEKENGFG